MEATALRDNCWSMVNCGIAFLLMTFFILGQISDIFTNHRPPEGRFLAHLINKIILEIVMSREENAHFHHHNHIKKSGTSSSDAKNALANDLKEDAESVFQAIPKLLHFFVNLGKLFLVFLLEPFVAVYVIVSEISFDKILTYVGYISLITFVVIPLQIFTFFITLPVKIGLVLFSAASDLLNIHKNLWFFILYGLQFKVLEFETNIEKLEKVKKDVRTPAPETPDLDAKLDSFILRIFQLFLTPDQMKVVQTALTGKESTSDDSKTGAVRNGK